MPKLLLKFNAAVIKEIPVEKTTITVGRKPENDVVIDNPAVSGKHCRILLVGDTFYVEDLDSTNGTFVNEKRVMKSGLHNNDVIGIAKHALVFVDERSASEAPAAKAEAPSDSTVVLSPKAQEDMAKAAAEGGAPTGKLGALRVLKGVVAESEYELKGMSVYIGKSDRVQVPIKGSGLFGGAPEVAASIHRKPEGYVLVAVEDGYPVVNGQKVSGQVQLKDGDIIEMGGTTLQFYLKG